MVVPSSKKTSASSQNGGTPDKKDKVNGVVPPQSETQTTQGKDKKELEKQQQLAAEKAKKEAERKAKELAEKEKKAAEKRMQEEEKAKKEAEQKAKELAEQKKKLAEKKETATALKKLTRDSELKDLGALGKGTNPEFVFNEGVLQNDGNGDYILIDGEKYYEYTKDESKQNPSLKYFYINRNHVQNFELQF